MVEYLIEEELELMNELALKITGEEDEFEVRQPEDIRFMIDFIAKKFGNDFNRKALAYCISIIVLHPFKNGNHRTSIMLAEHFLLKNNFKSYTNDKKDTDLEKWRINYEKKHDLEREFFRIINIEDDEKRKDEIEKIMNSEYGKAIEKWLRENYKQD